MTIAAGSVASAADVLAAIAAAGGGGGTGTSGSLTLSGNLTVNGALQSAITNGSLYVGLNDFRHATIWSQGTNNQIAQFSRIGSAGTDVAQVQSLYTVNHNGGPSGNIFNTQITTGASASPACGTWNFLAQLNTSSAYPNRAAAGVGTQVAAYSQAVRSAVTGGIEGVSLIGHVVEMHDNVDQPSSTRGAALTLELDWAGNNVDDDDSTGVVSVVLSKVNPSGSNLLVGNGIGFFGDATTAVKRVFDVNTAFTQAVLDTRDAPQGAGANAIWLASLHNLALSSDGKWAIRSDGTGIQFMFNGGQVGSFDQFSNLHTPGGITSSGTIKLSDNQPLSLNTAGTVQMRWNTTTARLESVFNGGVQAWMDANGNATFGGTLNGSSVEANAFLTPGNTIILSGATIPTRPANFGVNWAGTSTVTNNTSLCNVNIGAAADSAALTGAGGGLSYLLVNSNTATGFQGARTGVLSQLAINATTTLNAASDGLTGLASKVVGAANGGGVTTGFGVSNFGMGAIFGSNSWATLHAGATFYNECVGQEIDASIGTGASSNSFAIQQLILTSDHAVQGARRDAGLILAAQVGASAGVRSLMTFGDPDAQWPVDPNGYLAVAMLGQNNSTNASTAAGGMDLVMADFTGSGSRGGGFAWRSQGYQVLNSGAVQAGFGVVDGSSGGLSIDATYQQLSGTPTVSAGGANWTTGDVAQDANGNVVRVTASAGVATSVAVLKRGWIITPPSNPVAFSALTRIGASLGSGLTLTLAWTANRRVLMPGLQASTTFANDAAAATGGVAVGQLYRNGSVVQIRIA